MGPRCPAMSPRLALAAFLALIVPAFAAEPLAPPGEPASAFPKPDRPVAEIIAPLWASEAQRDKVDEVGQVAQLMRIAPGETVADIGAGSGYYTVRLAERVGPQGRVIAEDVTPRYLADLTGASRRPSSATSPWYGANRMTRGSRPAPSTWRC